MQFMSRVGASGLRAFTAQVDALANNIANVNTRDFTRKDQVFAGLLTTSINEITTPVINNGGIAHGVMVTQRHDFRHPGVLSTSNPLDLGILGPGFYKLELEGRVFYSNRGEFALDGAGRLVHSSGAVIPAVAVPQGSSLSVDHDGRLWLEQGGVRTEAGYLELVRFQNPQGLEHIGGGCFVPTSASGEPLADNESKVLQGYKRLPTVDLAEEMTRLLMAQRSYQVNARTVKIADEMWERANDLKR